eukprot:1266073-Ditylum_brightwellii.AAC.1
MYSKITFTKKQGTTPNQRTGLSKKNEKKKQAKLQGQKYNEDDNDLYDPVLEFVTLDDWNEMQN